MLKPKAPRVVASRLPKVIYIRYQRDFFWTIELESLPHFLLLSNLTSDSDSGRPRTSKCFVRFPQGFGCMVKFGIFYPIR